MDQTELEASLISGQYR